MKKNYPLDRPYVFMEDLTKEYGAEKAMNILIRSAMDAYDDTTTYHKNISPDISVYAKYMWKKRISDEKLLTMVNTESPKPIIEILALLTHLGYYGYRHDDILEGYRRLAHDKKVSITHDDSYGIVVRKLETKSEEENCYV